MDANVGLGLSVAQPGVEDTLPLELQEQFFVAATIFFAHGCFRWLAIIKTIDIIAAVDNPWLRWYRGRPGKPEGIAHQGLGKG